jgi:protein-arginine kinase activator protein McsA
MLILHVLLKSVKSQASGNRIEAVICEKCQTRFYYKLARTGAGNASGLVFFDESARLRAKTAAQHNLQLRLSQEAELVACPQCHWINQELIEKCRRQFFRQAISSNRDRIAVGSYSVCCCSIVTRPVGVRPVIAPLTFTRK